MMEEEKITRSEMENLNSEVVRMLNNNNIFLEEEDEERGDFSEADWNNSITEVIPDKENDSQELSLEVDKEEDLKRFNGNWSSASSADLADLKENWNCTEEPFKFFSKKEKKELYELIDKKSDKLYKKVLKLEAKMEESESNTSISESLPSDAMISSDDDKAEVDAEVDVVSPRRCHPFLPSEDLNKFSEDKRQLLQQAFELGWKREIVVNDVNSNVDVCYWTPKGNKLESMDEVLLYLMAMKANGPKCDGPELTGDNFSFEVARICYDSDVDIVRKVCSPCDSDDDEEFSLELDEEVKDTSSFHKEVFQASSPQYDFDAEILPWNMSSDDDRGTDECLPGPSTSSGFGGELTSASSLICSVRCPGLSGTMPDLQCKACFCLFHTKCQGVSPHFYSLNYICLNCSGRNEAPPPLMENKSTRNLNPSSQVQLRRSAGVTGVKILPAPPPLVRAPIPSKRSEASPRVSPVGVKSKPPLLKPILGTDSPQNDNAIFKKPFAQVPRLLKRLSNVISSTRGRGGTEEPEANRDKIINTPTTPFTMTESPATPPPLDVYEDEDSDVHNE